MSNTTVIDEINTHILDALLSAHDKAIIAGYNEDVLRLFALLAYAIKKEISCKVSRIPG